MNQSFGDTKTARFVRGGLAATTALVVLTMFPYTIQPTVHIKELLYTLAGALFAAVVVVDSMRRGAPLRRPSGLQCLWLVFWLLNVIAGLHSSFASHSLLEIQKLTSLLLLYFVAAQVYGEPEQVQRLLAVTCAAVALSSAYALCQYLNLDPFPWADRTSEVYAGLPGTFGNPNYAAHTLVLCVIMAVYLGTTSKYRWCLALTPVFLTHLYCTSQRGGPLALGSAVVLWVAARLIGRVVKRPGRAVVATAIVLVALAAATAAGAMALTKLRTGNPFPFGESLHVRYHSYYSVSRMILARPMLGYGPGNYRIENVRFWTPYEQRWFADTQQMNAHVHNDILEAAADAGLLAAGLYAAFFVLAVGRALLMAFGAADGHRRRLGWALAVLFFTYLVDGAFGFNFRVAPSALVLMLLAGALDGLDAAVRPAAAKAGRRAIRIAWRFALVVVGLATVVFNARVFASEYWYYWGSSAAHHGNLGPAQAWLAKGARLAPWNWEFGRQQGLAYARQGRFAEAVGAFDVSLEKNPYFIPTLAQAARTYLALGFNKRTAGATLDAQRAAIDEAERLGLRLLELCNALPVAEEIVGRTAAFRTLLLEQEGAPAEAIRAEWQRAETHLARAIELGAGNLASLYCAIAEARNGQDDVAGAEQAYRSAAQAEPARGETWRLFSAFAERAGRHAAFLDEAARQMRRLEEAGADEGALAALCLWRARILWQEG
ncbi:MAG TPA: hypothetical protein HPP77_08815, partial [Candidatus Hydrogenedentes bacterium]|nr:hypothetical protein [Candidatus Hydrogenedentota bacterium]